MNYYNKSGQMDLTDRVAIETGLCRGESFNKIAMEVRVCIQNQNSYLRFQRSFTRL